ncbi:AF4/FMR2 family member lilli-like [Pollicipes pollicipes]|uniref:AF4/FMR2 family member lilli-like n=1 Tax=Pollicipes pollicipes TaxID=41117 RepID=UPI001884E6EC|nr:AF4/FMR2 family member lilli-like [Pollicipes pollicipes]
MCDPYEPMLRPGSRAGLVAPGLGPNPGPGPGSGSGSVSGSDHDHQRFGHYANYEQIQHHLREKRLRGAALLSRLEQKFRDEARRQHQVYHSQRGRRAEPSAAERPISNYYEYESVQAVARGGGGSGGGVDPTANHSLPRHHERTRSGPATGGRAAGAGRTPGPAAACGGEWGPSEAWRSDVWWYRTEGWVVAW